MARKKKGGTKRSKSRKKTTRRKTTRAQQTSRRATPSIAEPTLAVPPEGVRPVLSPAKRGDPVYFGTDGAPLPNPWTTLGLPPGTTDPDTIQAAWRAAMQQPETASSPERVRNLRRCRDWLVHPDAVIHRTIGGLALPDPAAWGLEVEPEHTADGPRLPARSRVMAELMLSILAEDALLRVERR